MEQVVIFVLKNPTARKWLLWGIAAVVALSMLSSLMFVALLSGGISSTIAEQAQEECDVTGATQVYASDGPVRLPLAGKFKFTSEFGMRTQPRMGVYRLHAGIDLAMIPTGGDVLAAKDGTVQSVNPNTPGAGNYVVLDHGGGTVTRYLHMASMSVQAGQKVQAGQTIGVEGNTTGGTGISTGAHLHFEVKKNGKPIDPVLWLAKHGIDLPNKGGIATAAAVSKKSSKKKSSSAKSSTKQAAGKGKDAGVDVYTGQRGKGFALPEPNMGEVRHAGKVPPAPIPEKHMKAFKDAEKKYGVPWELLAGISMEETHHWSIQDVSSAGAMGPMQFMPATWATMGVDGDGDGKANITDVQDAIHSAANYLKKSGALTSPSGVRDALFAYNHATWYGNDVLWYAQAYAEGKAVTVSDTGGGNAGGCSPGEGAQKVQPVAGTKCVTRVRKKMSPQQRAGQLIMAALSPGSRSSLDSYTNLGNMLYLGGWSSGVSSVKSTSKHMQQIAPQVDGVNVGMLVAADQEGGQVQVLTGPGFSEIPSAVEQSDSTDLRADAKRWGHELKKAGVNVNLAPVADTVPTSVGTGNAPIGQWDRQYGSKPKEVSTGARAFAEGMRAAGVEPTVKHFPGIGRITGNTDLTAQGITDPKMTTDDPHLKPFQDAVDNGANLVMVGSARYPKLADKDTPAMFSEKIVTGLLREQIGYTGVVLSDDVGNAAAVADTPVGERATKFVAAGGDIVLTAAPDQVPTMVDALTSKAESNPTFKKKMNAAVTRVLNLKEDMGLLSCDGGSAKEDDSSGKDKDDVPAATAAGDVPSSRRGGGAS